MIFGHCILKKQNCKKFKNNPQHFFTEKLCDRMYSAYNLRKNIHKDINNTSYLTRSYSPNQLQHLHINNDTCECNNNEHNNNNNKSTSYSKQAQQHVNKVTIYDSINEDDK